MKQKRPFYIYIIVFVLAQIASFSLLGLWIYRYVINNIILSQVDKTLIPHFISKTSNVLTLIFYCILFLAVSVGMSLIFKNFSVQYRLTKLYDNFIANVTHELKSPLASIQLYLETIKKRNVPDDKKNEFVITMLKDVRRLKNSINTILDIAKLDQKKGIFQFSIYKADEIITNILRKSIEEYKLPTDSIHIINKASCKCVLEINAMKIIFDNLIDNAIKYSLEPVRITVNMKRNIKKFIVEFSDNGIGIRSKDQKTIFNKFQRIDSPIIPNVKGTGLGLYWVKEIVKYHKGKITVSSEPDKGTTFKIELPVYNNITKKYLNKLLK